MLRNEVEALSRLTWPSVILIKKFSPKKFRDMNTTPKHRIGTKLVQRGYEMVALFGFDARITTLCPDNVSYSK